MASSRQKAIKNIRQKMNKELLLRCEINDPYIEKYIDIAVIAIVDEIFDAINDHDKDFIRDLHRKVNLL